jgi:hypothetical protein
MSFFIPGNTAVENVRALALSALPDAPVVPEAPDKPRRRRLRAILTDGFAATRTRAAPRGSRAHRARSRAAGSAS